jgi:hypothetical protein
MGSTGHQPHGVQQRIGAFLFLIGIDQRDLIATLQGGVDIIGVGEANRILAPDHGIAYMGVAGQQRYLVIPQPLDEPGIFRRSPAGVEGGEVSGGGAEVGLGQSGW